MGRNPAGGGKEGGPPGSGQGRRGQEGAGAEKQRPVCMMMSRTGEKMQMAGNPEKMLNLVKKQKNTT